MDDREKIPLKFPEVLTIANPNGNRTNLQVRLKVMTQRMKTADYVLDGEDALVVTNTVAPVGAVIERKHSIDELKGNLSAAKKKNFIGVLDRMAEAWKYPFLLYDMGIPSLFKPTRHTKDPGPVFDRVQRLCMQRGVQFAVIPTPPKSRIYAGEYVARTLINGASVK